MIRLDPATLKLGPIARDELRCALDMLSATGTPPTVAVLVNWCDQRMTGGRLELRTAELREAVAELRDALIEAALRFVEIRS